MALDARFHWRHPELALTPSPACHQQPEELSVGTPRCQVAHGQSQGAALCGAVEVGAGVATAQSPTPVRLAACHLTTLASPASPNQVSQAPVLRLRRQVAVVQGRGWRAGWALCGSRHRHRLSHHWLQSALATVHCAGRQQDTVAPCRTWQSGPVTVLRSPRHTSTSMVAWAVSDVCRGTWPPHSRGGTRACAPTA